MAELKNTFSWSYSASEDFDACRRKRYWSKYGMWGGWDRNASNEQKAAYRRESIVGFGLLDQNFIDSGHHFLVIAQGGARRKTGK